MPGFLRTEGLAVVSAAPVPGAMPAHFGAAGVGTLFTNLTLQGTRDIAIPTHTNGDLLLLVVHMREGSGPPPVMNFDSINTAGWTQAGGVANEYGSVNNISKLGFGWKIGNGTETVVNITTSGGTSSDRIQARVHRFTATNGFAATPVQGIVPADSGGANADPFSLTGFTVTASDLRQLAVLLIANSSNVTIAAPTGASGGVWTEPDASVESSGSLGSMTLCTAGLSGGGSISGGSVDFSGNGHVVVVGFTLVPAQVSG